MQQFYATREDLATQITDPGVLPKLDKAISRSIECVDGSFGIELNDFHAALEAERLPDRVVRRALRIQARKALQGYSAIHPDTLAGLIALSNGDVLPSVPRYGSLGASGDLVPMAHAIAPAIRAGGVRGPRDVLGLVNTNAMMRAFAVELFADALDLLQRACRVI